ncbi:hypothetical protein AQUCO_00900197v1, partial [Aquilegia coerulea]
MKTDADRLSKLPDKLIHTIFSFLDMKEVVQTSFLSRRWRYTWHSLQSLNFDHSLWKNTRIENKEEEFYRKYGFMDFIDRVLLLRDKSSLHKLTLKCWDFCDVDRIYVWILYAARQHVVILHIEAIELPACLVPSDMPPIELPACLFPSDMPTPETIQRALVFAGIAAVPVSELDSSENKDVIMKVGRKDRLSKLPGRILCHIFSFLDMKQVVQTSILSRRWRYTWHSVRILNFNHSLWKKLTPTMIKKAGLVPYLLYHKLGFMDFVDRVLLILSHFDLDR